jgi:hypothetical protein
VFLAVHEPIIIAGIIAVVVTVGIAAFVAERRRKRQLIASLNALGLKSSLEDPSLSALDGFSRLGPLTRLRRGAGGVRWHAEGQLGEHPVTLLEHRYSTGAGKSRRTVYHTIAATPCPRNWPTLSLTPEHLFHKIAELLGSKDIKVEDPAFNSRWRVKGDSEDFTVLILSPPIQEFCQRLPRGVWLEIGQGALCLASRRRLDGPQASDLAQRAVALRSQLPPELEAWAE